MERLAKGRERVKEKEGNREKDRGGEGGMRKAEKERERGVEESEYSTFACSILYQKHEYS